MVPSTGRVYVRAASPVGRVCQYDAAVNASISDVDVPVAVHRGGSADSGAAGVRSRLRGWDVPILLGAAVVLGVVLPLVVAFRTGSIHIPHNDSWTFSRAAQAFARTGHVRLFGWDAMALVGLVVAAGPLGGIRCG